MDMETDTNPIDRSIAHLLFHRPSDPSVIPATEASSVKPHPMVSFSIRILHLKSHDIFHFCIVNLTLQKQIDRFMGPLLVRL